MKERREVGAPGRSECQSVKHVGLAGAGVFLTLAAGINHFPSSAGSCR